MRWLEIFKFELIYRAKRPDTYVFFAFLLLFSIIGVDFIFMEDIGGVKKNAPIIIAKTMGILTGLFMILASMIMGVPILRDFEYNIESLMFVNPVKKSDYLVGRFLGAFTVLLFIFSGVLFGMILGEFMPWQKAEDFETFNFFNYLKSFIYIVLPILFFGASLFFVSGALSKNLVVVYTQGIIFFVVFMISKSIQNDFIQAIFDPFTLSTLRYLTESWTVVEQNSQTIPMNGVLLYNKLLWFSLGVITLIVGYKKFNFNVINDKRSKKNKSGIKTQKTNDFHSIKIPEAQFTYGFKAKWNQLKHFTWFYFTSICKQPTFWAIAICGMIIILVNAVNLGTVYGVDSFPATYFIVEELQETSSFFFIIILVLYSSELIWKERTAKLNLIYDATSMSSFINLTGKFLGLILTYIVLMCTLIIAGIIFQTLKGYYNYQPEVYFYGFFLEILPYLALYTIVAFFFQVLVNKKFIGILALLFFFIINIASEFFGYQHDLYKFGGDFLGTYSDMNGYGHFLKPYLLIKSYWFIFGILLLLITAALSVRGTETNLKIRIFKSKYRFTKSMMKLGTVAALVFTLLGGYIFYNTNVLNKYWSSSEKNIFRASYEKTLKKFEYLPQPKIVDVNLKVELYPKTRDYIAEGHYVLTNMENEPIEEIHVQKILETQVALESVTFEKEFLIDNSYELYDYIIYKLKEPLQPNDSIKMNFKQTFTTKGFQEKGSNTKVVNNGTFFNNDQFPTLGYSRKYELQNKDKRAEFGLKARINKRSREDSKELVNSTTGSDSKGINFEIVIGTSNDQIAIAPGNLLKKWKDNNRNYFHYKMDKPMINFYAIVSARYEVMKDKWISSNSSLPVDLEIYYHKGHEYNLNRMMESMKSSFDYYSTNFTPYQYKQMRIMEFPRYSRLAQSFPNTVPYSESLGFMLDIDDEKDVDMTFFVTAHELAHQWWGAQVEAANVQGKYFIIESLAQYSALMVFKHKFPKEKVEQFLQLQLDIYREGRLKEKNTELPLSLVEGQDYIYYAKGALNMYALQEYIGEDNVNLALRRFIKDWHSFKNNDKNNRYANTKDLLKYFKEVTPQDLQYVITDLFEKVTEYDDRLNIIKDNKIKL